MDMHVEDMAEMSASKHSPLHRERLKLWLKSTMKKKKWSAERWAKEANVAGTTITRFLNSDDPHRTPSARTLEKLARAAGVPAMPEPRDVLIGLIRKDQLLDEARKLHPAPLDLFKMVALDFLPAPTDYAECLAVQMNNGHFALCCPVDLADLPTGKRVLVLSNLHDVAEYWYDPPRLVPVESRDHFTGTLSVGDPNHQIIGRLRGLFTRVD